MKKYVFLFLVTIVTIIFCTALISAQDTDTKEIPEGFVFYHYQDEFLDFSFIYLLGSYRP